VKTSNQLITGVSGGSETGDLKNPEKIREYIKEEILRVLISAKKPLSIRLLTDETLRDHGGAGSTGGEDNHHR